MEFVTSRLVLAAGLALAAAACRTPEPKTLLDTSEADAYWAVEPAMGGEQYIAPTVKFRLHNRSDAQQHSVQAMAVFRRKGEENLTWGSAFEQVVSRKTPLDPGQSVVVTLKSDARYHSQGPIAGMFTHPLYRDALVEYFIRVGSSGWVSFGQMPVERRVGARSVASESDVVMPSPPGPSAPASSAPSPSPARRD
jgi:hypothetical protein